MFKYRLYKILRIFHLISKEKFNKKTAKYTKEYKLLAKSKLFDAKWYLEQNPDVKAAKTDPIQHYLEYGWKEGREPSILFSGNKYLALFPDVRLAGINPLLHYEKFGRTEGRNVQGLELYRLTKIDCLFLSLLKYAANFKTKRTIVLMNDLIFDYRTDPIDNFSFFEYSITHKRTLIPYYILNKKNERYIKLKKKYGKYIIGYKNKHDIWFKIRILFLSFKIVYVLDSFDALSKILYDIYYLSPYITTIFTQHGITFFKQGYIKHDVYGQKKLNKTIVSNDFEYDIFKSKGKYLPQNIIKLGLFRWDKIQDTSYKQEKNSIFIYFTYRHYLHTETNLLDTTYFKKIISLLQNKVISSFLEQNNITFKIALHHDLLRYVDVNKFKDIKFISEKDILNAKNEAVLLITDYSSMCFEFFFQNKPVIFYRLDENEFNSSFADSQYSQNINELNQYIFNVVSTENDVVEKIKHYVNNNFCLEQQYRNKANVFFYGKKDIRKKFHQYLINNLERRK